MHRWTIFAVVLIPFFRFCFILLFEAKNEALPSVICMPDEFELRSRFRLPISRYMPLQFLQPENYCIKKQWKMTKRLRLVLQESGCFK